MNSSNRVYGLDILRAFAILFVIYSHSFFLIVDHINEREYNLFSLDGVTIFFVLSGFLIGGILLKTIEKTSFTFNDLLQFWIRRWFRTLPNYFFMLLLLVVLALITGKILPGNLTSYFFFLQNFASPHPPFFPEAWSLSVEEWFYLSVPLGLCISLYFLPKFRKNVILVWIASIILLVFILRIYRSIHLGINDFESWDNLQRKLVITRIDSIMFGFLGAWLAFYFKTAWLKWKKIMLILGLILLFTPQLIGFMQGINMNFNNYLTLSVTSAGTFLMLPFLSELRKGKGFIYRFLTFVSIVSYSMYLVNFSLIQLTIIPSLTGIMVSISHDHLTISIMRYIIYWGLTFGFSYLLYRFYEKPMMLLREKFRKDDRLVVDPS
ncbi:MAG: acyltransferase [Bacteroidetes bacterium]|nr:acyltransferase [Bacteroidota bacterium]